jgi:hypothetical protein
MRYLSARLRLLQSSGKKQYQDGVQTDTPTHTDLLPDMCFKGAHHFSLTTSFCTDQYHSQHMRLNNTASLPGHHCFVFKSQEPGSIIRSA